VPSRSAPVVPDARVPRVALRLLGLTLLARAPQGMAPLTVILLVQERTGSFAAAGFASGAWGLGIAVGQPVWARLAGRGRADRVIAATSLGQAAVLLTLAFSPWQAAAVAVAVTGLAGLLQAPVTSVARTSWPRLATDEKGVDRLFTLDATAQEVIWIAGPAIVGLIVAVSGPTTALVATAAAGSIGGLVFAAAVRRIWRPQPPHPDGAPGFLRRLIVPYVAMSTMTLGLGLGEVAVPAAAVADGHRDAAGLLLASWSVGSLVGGLLVARWPTQHPQRRVPPLLLAQVAGIALTAAVWDLGPQWLAGALFVSGLGLAPSFAAAYGVLSRRAPESRRTEAFGLASTFVLLGLAVGSALGGVVAEVSPTLGFVCSAAVTAVAAVIWWRFGRHVRRATSPVAG
jgi:MFS family permease